MSKLRRALAMMLLPASILPVFVLGPGIVRAPDRLLQRGITALEQQFGHSGGRP